jgi:hypothetical protein
MTPFARSIRPRRSRALLAGATVLLATSSFGALAVAEDARVKEMRFDVSSPYQAAIVNVTSTDGSRWDTIQPGNIGFHAIMRVDTAFPGYVERVGIFLGKCTNTGCAGNPRVFASEPMVRDYNHSANVSFPVDKLKVAAPSVFGGRYEETMLKLCNTGYSDARTPHTKYLGVDASFSVNTREKHGNLPVSEVTEGELAFNGGDHTRHGVFLVQLNCVATSMNSANPKPDPHRTRVTVGDLDLFLSTYAIPQGSQSGPGGTQCKPLKITTRIGTDKAGPVNVKLWRQVNGGPITSESKAMSAEALGGGKFGDDWNKFEHFTKTTTVQYKAEVLGGTFAPSTPWKSITIHCNGDYAAPQSNANPDNRPPAGKPDREVKLPPAVMPPCIGDKARGTACRKTAELPDKRRQAAERLRKAKLEAAERRRKAADAMMRRRQAALAEATEPAPVLVIGRPQRFGFRPMMPPPARPVPQAPFSRLR